MSNELKDIAERLQRYTDDDGWEITQAAKQEDGSWLLTIQPIAKEDDVQETPHDNN